MVRFKAAVTKERPGTPLRRSLSGCYTFESAARKIGSRKATCAIFVILQMSNRIRDIGAYFHSITLGRREADFSPKVLLERLSRTGTAPA